MSQVPQSAVLNEDAEPAPETPTAKRRPSWRSLNFGPRMWVAATIITLIVLMAVVGPVFYPYGPGEKVGSLYDEPSAAHLLGTDNFGHDIIAVLMYSSRNSLVNGLLAGTLAVVLGVVIGILAGYVGGWLEELLMGFTNIVVAIPAIIVLILLSMSLQHTNIGFLKGIAGLALVIGITSWPWTARAVRARSPRVSTSTSRSFPGLARRAS
jgi:peptide/nickel transport system permease protein